MLYAYSLDVFQSCFEFHFSLFIFKVWQTGINVELHAIVTPQVSRIDLFQRFDVWFAFKSTEWTGIAGSQGTDVLGGLLNYRQYSEIRQAKELFQANELVRSL